MEDEATPSSETGPTEARHVSWALNVSRLEKSLKWSSRCSGPKKVIWQNSTTRQSKSTRLWSRGQLMWKKNSRWCNREWADGLWWQHRLTASFGSVSFRNINQRRGSYERPYRALKGYAFMRLTELKLKGQYELTILTNGCLPPTYRVYKEITCSPRLVEFKGIPIRKGSRKIRPKETPKRKRLLI